jgi:hypothetical protein
VRLTRQDRRFLTGLGIITLLAMAGLPIGWVAVALAGLLVAARGF